MSVDAYIFCGEKMADQVCPLIPHDRMKITFVGKVSWCACSTCPTCLANFSHVPLAPSQVYESQTSIGLKRKLTLLPYILGLKFSLI